jgi:hypothetical protein
MKSLTAEELLAAWELGLNRPLLQRALFLMAAAFPEQSPDALLELSIGQRDLRLLQLRERLFGQQLSNSSVCPECGQRIEWENRVSDFAAQAEQLNAADVHVLDTDGYLLRFRLPNSIDIAAVVNDYGEDSDTKNAERRLLSRCVLEIEHAGTDCDLNLLPDTVIQLLAQRIDTLDPQADIRIQLNCPVCAHSWDVLFDIASYLCAEVNDWAEQMLWTVYKLASAYGWSERDILRLSPVRRQLYLGMLEA